MVNFMSHGKNGGGKRPGGKQPIKLGRKPRASSKNKKPLNLDFSDVPKRTTLRSQTPEVNARPNQRLGEFTIDRLSHDGRGLTQWNGKTLFVDGALPGERISARFVSEHGRYAEAVIDQVIAPDEARQQPPCPHYNACGGCQLQHMSAAMQLAFKQEAVVEQLQRWAGLAPRQLLPAISSSTNGYRSRARMGVWYEEDGSITLGFRQRQSKKLTAISNCLVLEPKLNQLLAPLQAWLEQLQAAKAVTHIELIGAAETPGVIIRHTKRLSPADRQGLQTLAQNFHCEIWLQGGTGAQLADINDEVCDPRLFYLLSADLTLGFHPQDFIQVNADVNQQMVQQALQMLALTGKERVLDLFCGIGNFTLPLARVCAEVTGIEAVESMVERGRENAAKLGLTNARFMAADLAKLSVHQIQQRCGEVDAILLDPPRDGAREILSNIKQLAARRIVYVSCNPATLARDAKLLAESGYILDSLTILDMFPHTAHVESMALFLRS